MGRVKVGITVGDTNGIGIEVILKALEDNRMLDKITPVIYGPGRVVSFHKKALSLNTNYQKINDASEAKGGKTFLLSTNDEEVKVDFGNATNDSGREAYSSLKTAVSDLAGAKVDVLVTGPINKKNIQAQGFDFPGHTEYLTSYSNVEDSLMFMIYNDLRVGVATNHLPLNQVTKELTKEVIVSKIKLMDQSLRRDFSIPRPRIAVLGLNPHAGENGVLGGEESEIILPAIDQVSKEGILAFGPYASDGLFGSGSFKKFDAVLAMYHDQGLTPFKAIAGGGGVNFTAGLPIVRTSPDHGTAFEIAGKNEASPDSLRSAIYLAVDVFTNRKRFKELTADPLVPQKK
ncbi:4-hydroxythreonine-4-phosphate dehydrogenase PdxA [Parvicella tangerina]|uniref:D-threonate 4-phosphate dehydrogenase n=1 Tax=Parvicella tangerina TaxID=2829795 RepID=A0A916JKH7_9FLAO|nr:4-hydroxythreonine-4-phosphate dehydrogenase PdxA [Parvicella tangerina]CAG5077686.1 D-threonate 4-phosphate dehydrogenase [Parvicella tangerina]